MVSVRGRGDSLEGPSLPPLFLPCRCHPSLSASLVPLAQAAPVPAWGPSSRRRRRAKAEERRCLEDQVKRRNSQSRAAAEAWRITSSLPRCGSLRNMLQIWFQGLILVAIGRGLSEAGITVNPQRHCSRKQRSGGACNSVQRRSNTSGSRVPHPNSQEAEELA